MIFEVEFKKDRELLGTHVNAISQEWAEKIIEREFNIPNRDILKVELIKK